MHNSQPRHYHTNLHVWQQSHVHYPWVGIYQFVAFCDAVGSMYQLITRSWAFPSRPSSRRWQLRSRWSPCPTRPCWPKPGTRASWRTSCARSSNRRSIYFHLYVMHIRIYSICSYIHHIEVWCMAMQCNTRSSAKTHTLLHNCLLLEWYWLFQSTDLWHLGFHTIQSNTSKLKPISALQGTQQPQTKPN